VAKWARYSRHTGYAKASPYDRYTRFQGAPGSGGSGGGAAAGWTDPGPVYGLAAVPSTPVPVPVLPNRPDFTLDDPVFGVLDAGNTLG
jgi:hypothetical protein